MHEFESNPFKEQPASIEGVPPTWIEEIHRPPSNVFEAAAELDNTVVTGIEIPIDGVKPGLLPNTISEWPGAEMTGAQDVNNEIKVRASQAHQLPRTTAGRWYS